MKNLSDVVDQYKEALSQYQKFGVPDEASFRPGIPDRIMNADDLFQYALRSRELNLAHDTQHTGPRPLLAGINSVSLDPSYKTLKGFPENATPAEMSVQVSEQKRQEGIRLYGLPDTASLADISVAARTSFFETVRTLSHLPKNASWQDLRAAHYKLRFMPLAARYGLPLDTSIPEIQAAHLESDRKLGARACGLPDTATMADVEATRQKKQHEMDSHHCLYEDETGLHRRTNATQEEIAKARYRLLSQEIREFFGNYDATRATKKHFNLASAREFFGLPKNAPRRQIEQSASQLRRRFETARPK